MKSLEIFKKNSNTLNLLFFETFRKAQNFDKFFHISDALHSQTQIPYKIIMDMLVVAAVGGKMCLPNRF